MEGKVHELLSVKWGVIPITVYHGVLVERLVGGYRVFGQVCNTPDEVDTIIQNACSSLSESLYKPDKLTVDCSDGANIALNPESGIIGSTDENNG